MELYGPYKYRGFWNFENDTADDFEFGQDLKKILSILIEHKMLIPKHAGGVALPEGASVDEIIDIIKSNIQGNDEFDIWGDTVIYAEKGEAVYSNIFTVYNFSTFKKKMVLTTKSDIWLPMSYDEEECEFLWNLERYNLNYSRIEKVLEEINSSLQWEENSKDEIEYNERGCIQIGYKLYLSEEVVSREYNKSPNPEFNADQYITEVNKHLH